MEQKPGPKFSHENAETWQNAPNNWNPNSNKATAVRDVWCIEKRLWVFQGAACQSPQMNFKGAELSL
jgi:hypothetical protein